MSDVTFADHEYTTSADQSVVIPLATVRERLRFVLKQKAAKEREAWRPAPVEANKPPRSNLPPDQIWTRALAQLAVKINYSSFKTWLRPVRFLAVHDGALCLEIPDAVFQEWLDAHYADLIVETWHAQGGVQVRAIAWTVQP